MHEPRYARLVPNRASDPQIVERLKMRVRDARVQLAAAIADGRGDDAWAAALVAISARGRFGVRLGLERSRAILEALGGPERSVRGALSAGTNGKGSVGALISAALPDVDPLLIGAFVVVGGTQAGILPPTFGAASPAPSGDGGSPAPSGDASAAPSGTCDTAGSLSANAGAASDVTVAIVAAARSGKFQIVASVVSAKHSLCTTTSYGLAQSGLS